MAAMLLCCTIVARAQSITGRVLDQQGNAIEFANVVLLSKADSVALTGTITGSTGAFSLQSSTAMANTCLRLSFVGYKPQTLCEMQPDMDSNKPLWMAQVNNTIDLPWDMKLNANLTYQGSGNTQNIMTKSMIFADIWLSKYFLKKQLRLNVGIDDITHGQRECWELSMGDLKITKNAKRDSRYVFVSLNYTFNKARSRYKGKNSTDELNRL